MARKRKEHKGKRHQAPLGSGTPITPGTATTEGTGGGRAAPLAPRAGRPAETGLRQGAMAGLLAMLFVGLACAVYLASLHLDLKYGRGGVASICQFGEGFDCTKVNSSDASELFGIPIALMAIPVYAWMMVMVVYAWRRNARSGLGVIAVLGALSTLYSAYLAYVSAFVIREFCLFCVTMYAVNVSALVLPVAASRGRMGRLLALGFRAVRDRRVVALSAVTVLLASGIGWGGYAARRDSLVAGFTQAVQEQVLASAQAPADHRGTSGAGQRSGSPSQRARAGAGGRQAAARRQKRYDVPVDDTVPFIGPSDAPVTIVLFDDFQCPFCRRLVAPMEQLLELYPKDVRLGFRHFPMNTDCNDAIQRKMHPHACIAAEAAECARRQGKFWPYYRTLFHNARDLRAAALRRYARDVGLDVDALTSCMREPATLEKVRADTAVGGRLKVTGTPTFFVNGLRFSGALPVEMLKAIVEAELAGQEKTIRELRDAPALPDVVGKVDAPDMVRIEEGPFGPFEIDAVEASVRHGKAVAVPGVPAATNLDWFEAAAACKAAGKRLCTEAEWLTACQGAIPRDANHNGIYSDDPLTGTEYPYGDLYKAGLCNDDLRLPSAHGTGQAAQAPPLITGNHPKCVSRFGVYDLSGNVREWIGTVPNRGAYIGGAFESRSAATCYSRTESYGPYHMSDAIGFRCCRGGSPDERVTHPGRQVGQKLKPFTVPKFEGGTFDARTMAGKPMVITFWASWCRVCRKELPSYVEIYPELKAKGVELLAINTDRDRKDVEAFLKETPLPFPVLLDPDNRLYHSFDAVSLPTTYLVDQKGNIRVRRTGYRKGDERKLLASLGEFVD